MMEAICITRDHPKQTVYLILEVRKALKTFLNVLQYCGFEPESSQTLSEALKSLKF